MPKLKQCTKIAFPFVRKQTFYHVLHSHKKNLQSPKPSNNHIRLIEVLDHTQMNSNVKNNINITLNSLFETLFLFITVLHFCVFNSLFCVSGNCAHHVQSIHPSTQKKEEIIAHCLALFVLILIYFFCCYNSTLFQPSSLSIANQTQNHS